MPYSEITPEFWRVYADQQRFLDPNILDAKAFARDESLFQMLNSAAECKASAQVDSLIQSHLSRSHNRSATLRNRMRLNREVVPFTTGSFRLHRRNGDQIIVPIGITSPSATVDRDDQLADLETRVPESDWKILTSFADGATYAGLADTLRCSKSALKSRVSRCRQSLRNAC